MLQMSCSNPDDSNNKDMLTSQPATSEVVAASRSDVLSSEPECMHIDSFPPDLPLMQINSFSTDSLAVSPPVLLCCFCLDPQSLPGGPLGCARRMCTVCELYNAKVSKTVNYDFCLLSTLSDLIDRLSDDLSNVFGKVSLLFDSAQRANYSNDNLSTLKQSVDEVFNLQSVLDVQRKLTRPDLSLLFQGTSLFSQAIKDITSRSEICASDLGVFVDVLFQHYADAECASSTSRCVKVVS